MCCARMQTQRALTHYKTEAIDNKSHWFGIMSVPCFPLHTTTCKLELKGTTGRFWNLAVSAGGSTTAIAPFWTLLQHLSTTQAQHLSTKWRRSHCFCAACHLWTNQTADPAPFPSMLITKCLTHSCTTSWSTLLLALFCKVSTDNSSLRKRTHHEHSYVRELSQNTASPLPHNMSSPSTSN